MGLYSTNRVSSVTPQTASLAESFELEENPNLGHIMEACIQIHENDAKMFNSLIELDFLSATNEAVMLEAEAEEANKTANGEKTAKISEKVKELFEAAIRAIKQFASNMIAKITELVKGDEKIIATYEDAVKKADFKDFKGIPNFAFPSSQIKKDEVVYPTGEETLNAINNASTKEDIEKAVEEYKAKEEKLAEFATKIEAAAFDEKKEYWTPESGDITDMIEGVKTGKTVIDGIKEMASKIIKDLKEDQSKAKAAYKEGKKGEELEAYRLKTVYEISSKVTKNASKTLSVYTNVAGKQLAAYRKALILCGRYAIKASKGEAPATEEEAKHESAVMTVIGESSDAYVFERLGY